MSSFNNSVSLKCFQKALSFPSTGSNSRFLVKKPVAYQPTHTLCSLMTALAYTIIFCAPMWMNIGTFSLIKIYSEVSEDSAFISSGIVLIDADMADISMMMRQKERQRDKQLFSFIVDDLVILWSIPSLHL